MTTFALIHGAGDVGWYWHLVQARLEARGHDVVAPDLPCDDDSAGLADYADAVVQAVGRVDDLVVVGQSLGGFVAPLVCERLHARLIVLVAPLIPAPHEAPADYWTSTRYDEGPRPPQGPEADLFYQDVPPDLAAEARRRARAQSEARMAEPTPMQAWPDVETRVLLCRDDRLLPPPFVRLLARERLGVEADEMDGGHTPALSRPDDLAERLDTYARQAIPPRRGQE